MKSFAPETGGGGGEAPSFDGSEKGLDGRVIDTRGDPAEVDWSSEDGSGQAVGTGELPDWAPPGLPSHMLGQNERETLGKVFKAFEGARTSISERGIIPSDLSGYTFEPSEVIAPFAADFANDPVYVDVQKAAQEAGITDKQFAKFLPRVLEGWIGNDGLGLVKPVDFHAEVMKLVPPEASDLDEIGQRNAAGRRINDALAFLDGVKEQGLDPDVADYLVTQLGDDARGIRAIEFFRSHGRKLTPALGGRGGGGMSDDELSARLKDERYNPNSLKFDRAFAAETDRLFKERYGDKRGA